MLLNCHTYYSFHYGTYSVEGLINELAAKGYDTFALTDINNTSACLDTIRLCRKAEGIKPVVGIDFRNGVKQQYVGLAINNEGFTALNRHLSAHLDSKQDFGPIAPELKYTYIIYPFEAYRGWTLRENEYVGVSVRDLSSFAFASSKISVNKLVALHSVTFSGKQQFNMHRLLRAIDNNVLLSMLPGHEQATGTEVMPAKGELYKAYQHHPGMVGNTERLLSDCHVGFVYDKLDGKNKKYYSSGKEEDMKMLKDECLGENLRYRYPNAGEDVHARIEKELGVIAKMNFTSYFLINWDITKYARRNGYYYVGRGSGANSIVAYLLRITDVNPIDLDLYFERFINEYRSNAPDFDIDFSWTDRDDITRYIFEKYGNEHTALLGSYNTFQQDAITRELGKVFGLPPREIDYLQKTGKPGSGDELSKLVLKYSERLKGFPSHLSVHSSGIIISEEPIYAYSAMSMPPKGYQTTQFSMQEAEDIGLCKFDILSQRGLAKIKDSLKIISENRGEVIDIHQINEFKQDEEIKKRLKIGDTTGCFYVESPAMRMLLTKLKADDYLRLVAASSIIRPGVSKSGMMREYIMRFQDIRLQEEAEEKLPQLYNLLRETYGVMVYQEDVIKIAHFFAGLTLEESDILRRGMSWKFKRREEFAAVKDKFFNNCKARGYPDNLVKETWDQIESFANFAFSKGHSASYAVESYQALYLKAHFPLEYMVATLNNGGGFFRPELYVHEARMKGGIVHPPCVNNSRYETIIRDKEIFLGLSLLKDMDAKIVSMIVKEREKNGLFGGLQDFTSRVPLSIEQMRILVRVGAFNFTGKQKKAILWEMYALLHHDKNTTTTHELFRVPAREWKLPDLTHYDIDDAFDEMEILGFPLCSPFKMLKDGVPDTILAKDLTEGQIVTISAYFIHNKRTWTGRGENMFFGTFLDFEGKWVDTVHFPPVARAYPFNGPGCYTITGKVTVEYGYTSIEVHSMKRLETADREKDSDNKAKAKPLVNLTIPNPVD